MKLLALMVISIDTGITSAGRGINLSCLVFRKINYRELILRWTFLENGTIESGVGLTGQFTKTTSDSAAGWQVTAQNKIATSFVDHYFWRLDFDIASDNGNDVLEQIESIPSADRLTKAKQTQIVSTESAASFNPEDKKF